MRRDFVTELIGLVGQLAPVEQDVRQSIEKEIRARYGGERVFIRARQPIEADYVESELRNKKSVRQIAEDSGCSRLTIYRRLKKYKPRQK